MSLDHPFLIVNPMAGHRRAKREWPAIARQLKLSGVGFDAVFTERPGDGTRLTIEALERGARTVVAVGGDGTANEVANGFFEPPEDDAPPRLRDPAACFGFIPMGTAVDLSRLIGLRDRSSATRALVSPGRTIHLDVGRACFVGPGGQPACRYFLVGADLGLGGETVATLRATGDRGKALGGTLAYLAAVILTIARHRPARVRFAIDGGAPVDTETDLIYVANGRFIAGGMIVAPTGSSEDGRLDLIVVRRVSKATLLLRLLPAIYRGTHLKHPAVSHRLVREVRVEAAAPLLLQLDGEQPGVAPATFSVVPGILPVRVP